MGVKGKGHHGTYIKDPWKKPRGLKLRVGCRSGWCRGKSCWENGDTCIRTIKIEEERTLLWGKKIGEM